MSVNSATDTFTDGAELFDQEKYSSTVSISIEPDPIQMEQDFKKPLSERISTIHPHGNGVRGTSRLDDVVVDCVTPAFRQHEKNQWNTVKAEAENKNWSWTATAIVSGLGAAIGAILLSMGPTEVAGYLGATIANTPLAPILLVVGGVTAVVSLFFIAAAKASITQANDQISKWDADPVLKIGRERNEAYDKGFPFIFAHGLKLGKEPSYTGRFHPTQVEYAYKKYFEAFCKKLLDQSCNTCKTSWMKQFRSSNPISSAMMTYGLGHIPAHMKPVLEDYTRFESFLSDIASSYDRLKSDVRAAAKERVDGYNKSRNEQLQPYADARDRTTAVAKAERDRIYRDHPLSTDRHHKEAKEAFDAIKKALEDDYSLRAGPINKKYEGKIKEVEKEQDERIKKLDDQTGHQLASNYNAAHELLVRAKQAWDNKGYQPVNFQQYFPYQNAQPVYYQQQQPAYQQPVQVVYQQQPVYQQQVQPPVYQQQPGQYQQTPNVYPQVPQYDNRGYGQYVYGQHNQHPIPAQQQYFYVRPTAPNER